jgi:hypothetical protein
MRRMSAARGTVPRWLNVIRAVSSEGHGRVRFYSKIRRLLDADTRLRRFFEQEATDIPQLYVDRIRRELGSMWEWLPKSALHHDVNAYLKAETLKTLGEPVPVSKAG